MFDFIQGRKGFIAVDFQSVEISGLTGYKDIVRITLAGNGIDIKHEIEVPILKKGSHQYAIATILNFFKQPMKPIINDKWLEEQIVEKLSGYSKN